MDENVLFGFVFPHKGWNFCWKKTFQLQKHLFMHIRRRRFLYRNKKLLKIVGPTRNNNKLIGLL